MERCVKVGDKIRVKYSAPYHELVDEVFSVRSLTALDGDIFVRVKDVDYYLYRSEYEIVEDKS